MLFPLPLRQWHDRYPSALCHIANSVALSGLSLVLPPPAPLVDNSPPPVETLMIHHCRNRRPKGLRAHRPFVSVSIFIAFMRSPIPAALLLSLGPLPVLFHPRGRLCRYRHLRPLHLQLRARLLIRRKRNPMQHTPHRSVSTLL
jgi:hypothetical protein